jgi:hypothetical protein
MNNLKPIRALVAIILALALAGLEMACVNWNH